VPTGYDRVIVNAMDATYSQAYFAHYSEGAIRSAQVVLSLVRELIHVTSVADFGCGTGSWLAVWERLGITDVVGSDRASVGSSPLLFPASRFVAADLARPVYLGRRFDLVQSLEVAEHLPAESAAIFVDTLVSHASIVLFSAAPPGQGGEHHVNERPLEYWRTLFRRHGFIAVDALRPRLAGDRRVEPWYRYNTLLLMHESRVVDLQPDLSARLVPDGSDIPNYAPWGVRIQHAVLRWMPEPVVTRVAVAARQLTARDRRAGASGSTRIVQDR